jgi:hypothetical protein
MRCSVPKNPVQFRTELTPDLMHAVITGLVSGLGVTRPERCKRSRRQSDRSSEAFQLGTILQLIRTDLFGYDPHPEG